MERQRTILLVDDDPHVRQALGEALTDENYQVALAANGPEAVEHLREPRSEIDAVLLGLRLGLEDGWNVLCRLAALQPGLPVILMSGTRGACPPRLPGAPVTVLEKPLDLRRLFKTLQHVTARPEPVQPPTVPHPRDVQDRSAA
jgi:DNA-binding NtrC family response regulator